MARIRVLLADDHPMMREGTRQLLDQAPDMEVVGEAVDGEDAVLLAQRLCPDILLLDISMPRLNGVEVAKILRERLPDLRIVAFTGYEENEHYNEALVFVGVKGYMSKRAAPSELLTALREVHAGGTHFLTALDDLPRGSIAQKQPTQRELEVLHLVDEGCSNRQIADRLSMTEPTVRFHLHNLFNKLGVSRRTQLVSVARQSGML
ncbi:MAG: response regulator [Chloroflexota bacterium]